MKQFIVGSGWKMVKTYQDSIDTARELEKRLEGFHEFPVVIFPSFPAIPEICRKLSKESALKIGGQDLFWEDEGAYTGEISGKMLLEIGCQYVEINHQERRKYLHEDNEMANRKLKQALRLSLTPFLCMGEEEEGSDEEVRCFIENQLSELLDGVGEAEASHIIFAYEPRWGIGKKNVVAFSYPERPPQNPRVSGKAVRTQHGKTGLHRLRRGNYDGKEPGYRCTSGCQWSVYDRLRYLCGFVQRTGSYNSEDVKTR